MNRVKSHNLSNGTGRLVWIDALRGFAILLVIVGHTSPPFQKLIYGFHMPLFFVLSGFLYKGQLERNEHEKIYVYIKKSFVRYIIPYFVLCTIMSRGRLW